MFANRKLIWTKKGKDEWHVDMVKKNQVKIKILNWIIYCLGHTSTATTLLNTGMQNSDSKPYTLI